MSWRIAVGSKKGTLLGIHFVQYDVNQKQEGGQRNLKVLNAEIQIVEEGLVDRTLRTQQNLVLMVGIKSCKLSSDTNVRGTKLVLLQS